jgi:hypothetical protein
MKNKTYTQFPPTMTLADFNKVKYSDNKAGQINQDVNSPQRIQLPPYFNTPQRVYVARKDERSLSPTKK